MPRIARVVAVGCPHHVARRGSNRMDLFLSPEDREFFLANLRQYMLQTGTQVQAWCLMSNHFHLLIVPTSAQGHVRGRPDPLLTHPDWLEDSERAEYRRFVSEPGDEAEIRRATSTGRPLGGPDFIARLERSMKRRLAALPRGRPRGKT